VRAAIRIVRMGVVLALAACGGNGGGGEDAVGGARAEIERLGQQWEEAANTGQVERLMEVYAPDAVILPPGGPTIEGSETIRELFRQEFERFDTKIAFTTTEIEVEGDMAYRRGGYVWRGTPRGTGQPLETRNKFLEIWKRQPDGTWRIAVDMWNPAESPAATGGVGISMSPEEPGMAPGAETEGVPPDTTS
jgi:uncharacterized protein (TIGR02246 family)